MDRNNKSISGQKKISILVIIIGVLIAAVLIWTGPKTLPTDEKRGAKIVRTMTLKPATHSISIVGYGTVIPAQRVVISPEVQGRILDQHPNLAPGGFVRAGETLFEIDPSDYEIALKEQEFALEEARFALEMEQGNQVVASREWKLLQQELPENEINRALVLREPHLRRAEANLQRARNQIERAQLLLSRATVKAPFNAMVLNESVELGQLVDSGANTCTLIGSDRAWIMTTVSLEELKHISFPSGTGPGSKATIYLDTGGEESLIWQGQVSRLLSDLEPTGRMARVIVETPDPYGLQSGATKSPLLIGSYVKVVIEVGVIENALEISRTALREGSKIWVVDESNQLQIRDINILWSRQDTALIENLMQPGESLVVSGLKVALPGMKVDPYPVEADDKSAK